jgi:signal transduction histidine kinase
VNVDVRRGDRRTAIAIADDGPGLPDIERAVIATGEETPLVHGKGLGLWLVYWIVESLDGDLRVRDTDRGSCVEMRFLPADAA